MIVLYLVLIVVISIVGAIAQGWALSTLWSWFVADFLGLPLLTIPQAIGIALLVGMFFIPNLEEKDKDVVDLFLKLISKAIFYPLIVVGLGWLVLQFM